jgi:uncharacterized protein DUF642
MSSHTLLAHQIISSPNLPQAAEGKWMPSLGRVVSFPLALWVWVADEGVNFIGRRSTLGLLWLAGFLCSVATAHANLLSDGDFETPGNSLTTNFIGLVASGNQNALSGWTAAKGDQSSGDVYYSANNSSRASIPNAESGNYCVQLSSTTGPGFTTGSSINQSLALSNGANYVLSFWINSTANGLLFNTSTIDYSITGAGLNFNRTATTQNAPLFPNKNQPWTHVTFSFTAAGNGNVTFNFQDDPSNGTNSVSLDNVDLEIVTPEFSHWSAFFIFGIACVALETHRRRKARENAG